MNFSWNNGVYHRQNNPEIYGVAVSANVTFFREK